MNRKERRAHKHDWGTKHTQEGEEVAVCWYCGKVERLPETLAEMEKKTELKRVGVEGK